VSDKETWNFAAWDHFVVVRAKHDRKLSGLLSKILCKRSAKEIVALSATRAEVDAAAAALDTKGRKLAGYRPTKEAEPEVTP
jgi:hypothetical protein